MTVLAVRRLTSLKLQPIAAALVLALPLFLFYARALADISVTLIGLLFLVESARTRDWAWLRRPWVWCAAGIWALELVGAARTGPLASVLQSAAMIRLLILVAALEGWVLVDADTRRRLQLVLLVLAGWTALQVWQQQLTGSNIFGDARWGDGALTGPFLKPRAGGVFLFAALLGVLPEILRLLQGRARQALAGAALLLGMVVTMVIIGQRMPNLLLFLGLGLTALLVRQARRPMLVAAVVAIAALVALPVVSPPTYAKLVLKFADQMEHFLQSPYGQLYGRAAVMMWDHPLTGLGFDGFRNLCADPAYVAQQMHLANFAIHDPASDGCNMHPHNYYLQVGVAAGVSGLVLFLVMLGLWLTQLLRARRVQRGAAFTALVVTFCVAFWPIASSSSLFTFDTAGWVFLTAGWALAATRP
jgi:O-antigen ligase